MSISMANQVDQTISNKKSISTTKSTAAEYPRLIKMY
jgi:hypothetical protein